MLCTNFDIIPLPDSDAPAVAYSVTMIFPLAFAFSCASDFRNLGADFKHIRNYFRFNKLTFKNFLLSPFDKFWCLPEVHLRKSKARPANFSTSGAQKNLSNVIKQSLTFMIWHKNLWTEEKRMFELKILHLFFILTSFPGPSIMKEVRIDKPSNQWLAVWLGWSQIPTGPLYMTWLTSDISQFGKFPSMRPTESASLLFWKSLAKCSLMIVYFFCFYEFTVQSLYVHNTKFGSVTACKGS